MCFGKAILKFLMIWLIIVIVRAGDSEAGRNVFNAKCSSCHTIGKGKLVGPDLKGVTERRDLEWLKKQIMFPDKLVNEGDPIATELVKEYGVPMANLGITEEEAENLVAYFKEIDGGNSSEIKDEGFPPAFIPSIIGGILLIVLITIVSLRAGKKEVIPII